MISSFLLAIPYRIVFLIVAFTIGQLCYSQSQISFRQLSVKDGLSQNSVVAVAQDSIGYLWIATQNGLNKYDGKAFTNYKFDFVDITRPTYSYLGKIYIDRLGGVFIIPLDRKLYRYNALQDTFTAIEGISDASTIYQDVLGNYWIGTYNKGLQRFDSNFDSFEIVVDAALLSSVVYDIAAFPDSKLLITADKKLVEVAIDSKQFRLIAPETLLGNEISQNFSVSVSGSANKQWIGTFGDGLYYKEGTSDILHRFSDIVFTDPLPNNLNILDLHKDHRGRLWMATYGSGLYMIDFKNKKISHFSPEKYNPKAIHYNDVLCIYEDYTGTLWFGTDGAGLSYYDEALEKFNSFTNLQTPENINIDVVRAITVDQKNTVWLGTSGKGLTEYDPTTNSWRTFTTLNSDIPSDRIMSLYLDTENDLWVGTQGDGLSIYNEKDGFRNVDGLPSKTIWTIYRDSKQRIWLGTQNNGLIQYDKIDGVVKNYRKKNGQLSSDNIRVITEDSENNLWVGTDDEGVVKLNPQTNMFTEYKRGNNALSNNGIKSLYYDQNDVLWIGTNGGGLNTFDTKSNRFYSFSEEDGLANNVIYAILPDEQNNLWLSSNKGITRFSVSNNFKDPVIKNYDNYAGLATEFNTGAYFRHKNGDLYYGGLEGFYWFNPNEIEENDVLPKTTITGLEVLSEARPLVPRTELKHNENTLTFTFSSLQFALPEKNQFKYQLLNYDDKWIDATSNSVRYTRLPPGDYTLQVKSSNYDGVWNDTPATFEFKINAPWYFNFYSKLGYVILLLISLYTIYKYFKWRWQMKLNLQLQEQEAQRLKQLNEYKSKLYTDVAHEFRTPLTLIAAPVDAKLTAGKLSDFDYANLSSIKRNTSRLTALVDQLLQLAKLEKGKQKLKFTKGDLGLFLNTIAESFQYKAQAKKLRFSIEIDKIARVWYDEDAIEKIVSNLLSNAVKYTPEEGWCRIKASTHDSKLELIVSNSLTDDFSIETERLFDRFYQQDEYTEGVGVGLSLVKELVKLYKGVITVKTDENVIAFRVELPLNKKAFAAEEIEILKKQPSKADKDFTSSIDLNEDTDTLAKNEKPILLVVEDNDEVRNFIARSLKHKYHVLEAVNGQEGVQKAIEQIPDIVLSDIRMPLKNGIELCNTIKTDERTSHIPVILLTADTGEENELKGLESGADDFITKPFKLRILEKTPG